MTNFCFFKLKAYVTFNAAIKLLVRYLILILPVILIVLPELAKAQHPYLKAELKTNLSKITCLDNFEIEAKQINWQFLNSRDKSLLLWDLHFVSSKNGYALASVWGSGGVKYLYKTTDGGKNWDLDQKIKQAYISQFHFFGNDSIVLLSKKTIDWYVFKRYRYFSKDGGQSWDSIQTNIPTEPVLTTFLNFKTGYCVDENNGFYASTDGGINWTKQGDVSIGFKKKLYSSATNNIFLLNDSGLTRSKDGGKTWGKIQLPLEYGFTDFCMKDNVGFISGRMGRILKTEDGGETWKIVNSRIFPQLSKIGMLNKDSVYMVGDLGTILFTSNGGSTWKQHYADNRNDLYDINILDRENIFIGGMYGIFTYNEPVILSNYQWDPQNLILLSGENRATAISTNDARFHVSAKDEKGILYKDSILVDIDPAEIFISADSVADNTSRIRLHTLTDAGTWSLQNEDFTMGVYHDLDVVNQDTIFIVGQCEEKGVMLRSTDGGKNWFHVNQNIEYRIDDIEFVNSKVAYAAGYMGYLIKTVDGGSHWNKLNSPTKEHIKSISFLNENMGYVAADFGHVYKTYDGGMSWESSVLNYDFAVKILFLNEQKGFLLHSYSGFLNTLDGGKTWQEVPHDKMFDVTDLTFVNENIGYATGGMLAPFLYLKTVDGGKTWTEKIYPRWTLTTYQTISFKDEYSGFVFNQLGEIVFTGDGGQNWFILDTLKYNEPNTYGNNGFPINAFKFINSNTAIGVGNGQIVRYEYSPEIKNSWSPETKVEGKTTAHPNVPSYLSQSYVGSISRNLACKNSMQVTLPQINVFVPSINQTQVSIYPQPATDVLFVSSSELSEFEMINIFDGRGILLYSSEIKGNVGVVSIKPKLAAGMYIIEIRGKKHTVRKEIIFL